MPDASERRAGFDDLDVEAFLSQSMKEVDSREAGPDYTCVELHMFRRLVDCVTVETVGSIVGRRGLANVSLHLRWMKSEGQVS